MTHVTRITDRDDYETPRELFDKVNKIYKFDVDAASTPENCLCVGRLSDALTVSWREPSMSYVEAIWCNPPFSKKEEFIARALQFRNECRLICFLLPANAPETAWWRYMVFEQADQIIYLTPRVNYNLNGKPVKGVPFPSCLVFYYPRIHEAVCAAPAISCWDWKK